MKFRIYFNENRSLRILKNYLSVFEFVVPTTRLNWPASINEVSNHNNIYYNRYMYSKRWAINHLDIRRGSREGHKTETDVATGAMRL